MKQKKEIQTFHLNNDLSNVIQNYIDLEFDFAAICPANDEIKVFRLVMDEWS